MKRPKYFPNTLIKHNTGYEAEPLMFKMRKVMESKEPIEAVSPMIYTNKKDGVLPGYDIRTDRFEIAREAMGKVRRAEAESIAKRQETPKIAEPETPGAGPS